MKLYHTPGACSLAPHIALREAALDFSLVRVDLRSKTIEGGGDYLRINRAGAVPALDLGNGEVLTENAVILQYVAELAPSARLLPQSGLERYRVLEWIGFVATELHKGFAPMFSPQATDDLKVATREKIGTKLDLVQERLGDRDYVRGARFTAADAYLFTILRWTDGNGIALSTRPALERYRERVWSRPHVQEALKAEGLV
jgi:glutathione S-transferase